MWVSHSHFILLRYSCLMAQTPGLNTFYIIMLKWFCSQLSCTFGCTLQRMVSILYLHLSLSQPSTEEIKIPLAWANMSLVVINQNLREFTKFIKYSTMFEQLKTFIDRVLLLFIRWPHQMLTLFTTTLTWWHSF